MFNHDTGYFLRKLLFTVDLFNAFRNNDNLILHELLLYHTLCVSQFGLYGIFIILKGRLPSS